MAKTWQGPTAALVTARADPLYAAIIRRNARKSVFSESDQTGRIIQFYTIAKRAGEWYRTDLGSIEGADPTLAELWGSHQFTDPDAELFKLHLDYIERLIGDAEFDFRHMLKRTNESLFGLEDVIASVRA